MKKIIFWIILILSFCIVDRVEAIHCLYRNEDMGVDVAVYSIPKDIVESITNSENKVVAQFLNGFEAGGEQINAGDKAIDNVKLVIGDEKRNLQTDDKCYNYLYYDVRNTHVGPVTINKKNYVYVGETDHENVNYDVMFSLVEPYSVPDKETILEEMVCTYSSDEFLPITFKIYHDGMGNGNYELWLDHKKAYRREFKNYVPVIYGSEGELIDHFDVRLFWDSKGRRYFCPDGIAVGTDTTVDFNLAIWDLGWPIVEMKSKLEIGYKGNMEITDSGIDLGFWDAVINKSKVYNLNLQTYGSYIDPVDALPGQVCNYTRPNEPNSDWFLALHEYKNKENQTYNYITYYNDLVTGNNRIADTSKLPKNRIMDDCSKLPTIYTDCLNVPVGQKCTISETAFSRKDSSGNEMVELLVEDEWRNSRDGVVVMEAMGNYTGYTFKKLSCELSNRLQYLDTSGLLSKTINLDFYTPDGQNLESHNISSLPCDDWIVYSDFKCDTEECKSNIEYLVEKQVKETMSYCQNRYKGFSVADLNDSSAKARMEECIRFDGFYDSLVNNGIIRDLSSGCNILSNDFTNILKYILDIMKIAGPLLALGLGTLDFIKAIASGDADKEMKNAFKRFSTRVIAAILLFIIPFILAFLMDMFIGNQDGYNTDNPFCGLAFEDES